MFDNELKLKGRLDSASNADPDDVLPAKNKLKDLGLYDEPDYGMTPYPDDRLFEGIKKAQQQGGLTVDGIMKPGGETESYVNKIWNEKYGQGKLNRDFGIASPQASSSVPVAGRASLSHNGFTQDYDLRRKNLLNEDVKKAFAEHDRTNLQLQNPKTEYADWSKSVPYNYQGNASLPTGREDVDNRRYADIPTGLDAAFSGMLNQDSPETLFVQSREDGQLNRMKNQRQDIKTLTPDLHRHEGLKQYPYCDTKGKITVGIGKNVHNKSVFDEINWTDNEGKPVSLQSRDEQYQKLKELCEKDGAAEANKTAKAYENSSSLRISKDEAERITQEHLKEDYEALRGKFPDFDELPPSARQALLDMNYNMGNRFNPEDWSDLFQALHDRDFEKASQEVHRTGINESRNEWTADKMRKAAQEWERMYPKK